MTIHAHQRFVMVSAALAFWLAATTPGAAQTMSASASSFNAGYKAASGEFNAPVNVDTRDANGNRVIVDGVIQSGSSNGVFNKQSQTGVGDTVSGAGVVGANTAIGNNITVITQGSNNTVIVNATQTNTGAVTATTVLNGQINLNNGG